MSERLRDSLAADELVSVLLEIYDASRQGIVVHDRHGRIVDANPAASRLLGPEFEEMRGTDPASTLWDRLRELDGQVIPAEARPAAVVLATGNPLLGRLLIVRRTDADDVTLRVDAHPIQIGDRSLIVTSFVDINSEVAAQRTAAAAHTQLENTLAAVEEFVFTAALTDQGLEPVYLGPGIEQVSEGVIRSGANLLVDWERLVHPADRERVRDALSTGLAGEASRAEYRLLRTQSSERWVRLRMVPRRGSIPLLIDGVLSDITSERRVQEEMEKSQALVELSGDFIAIAGLDGGVTFVNRAGRALVGLSPEADVTAMRIADFLTEEGLRRSSTVEQPAVRRDGGWRGESTLRHTVTGESIAVEVNSFMVTHPVSGEPLALATVQRDIRDRLAALSVIQAGAAAAALLAEEQGALRRIATAIAEQRDTEEVFGFIAAEITSLFGVDGAVIVETPVNEPPRTLGVHPSDAQTATTGRHPADAEGSVAALLRASGQTTRLSDVTPGALRHRVAAPVEISGRLWGYVAIGSDQSPDALPADAEERLERVAAMISTAVIAAQAREDLLARANTDPVTNVLNHRSFQERLHAEFDRAQRHSGDLAVTVVDLDGFKAINDAYGHQAGDGVLRNVAKALAEVARSEDVIARLGGDEFVLLLPGTAAADACLVAERFLEHLSAFPSTDDIVVAASIGVADLTHAHSPSGLLRVADGALYWAKVHARGTVRCYSPDIVRELSAQDRAEQLARSQALTALRALARVTDLKDPSTAQHSERVAELALALATACSWPTADALALRQAALIHDVGKIAVPDEILFKPGALTDEEYENVKRHAALGADIAAEALDARQVAWIRHHHERPDGRGYPDGLTLEQIPEGAQLLAVADSWDVMINARHYKTPKSPERALEECRQLINAQFSALAVETLSQVISQDGSMIRLQDKTAPRSD